MTYRTIADAALTLTAERGLSGVTIEQIAERSFVSPRTVSNYFPSKEAALLAAFDTGPDSLLDGLASRPTEEHPLRSVAAVLLDEVRSWDASRLQLLRDKEAMLEQYPALVPHRLAQLEQFDGAIRAMIAARTDSDPATDLQAQLIAGAATAALKSSIRLWSVSGGDAADLASLLERSFDALSEGLQATAA
ncbi:TetR/AcrR family transcriptional regulator [Agrococcus sp. 1P02AA]|uniref:TetR/AcrR family transcriptional regulator n=1 Tax=Agrococcus sp. 1P02AA TaxID=3132259 RepID=UPI0039A6898D